MGQRGPVDWRSPVQPFPQKSHLGQDAQSLLQLSFDNPKGGKSPLLCAVILCHVIHEWNCLWPWRESGLGWGAAQQQGRGETNSSISHPCALVLIQTLTGEELKLHVSSSNVVLFSFNLTTGTIIPSQSGYDLHVSDLPASNSTEPSVGLAVAEGKKSPQVFITSLLKQGMMGSLSGQVTSSVSCAVGRQGDQ